MQKLVEAARAVLPGDPATGREILAKAQDQAEDALAEVRRSVGALREPRPARRSPRRCGSWPPRRRPRACRPSWSVTGRGARRSPPTLEESLFRAAQEGLTNVRKHAGAAAARLVLDYARRRVRLDVCDDGGRRRRRGDGGGFGLVGLRERAARLGGRLDVRRRPGRGARCTWRCRT